MIILNKEKDRKEGKGGYKVGRVDGNGGDVVGKAANGLEDLRVEALKRHSLSRNCKNFFNITIE